MPKESMTSLNVMPPSLQQVAGRVNTARSVLSATLCSMSSSDSLRQQQGERLRAARLTAGFRSAREAALSNNWPESTVRAHESGTRTIGQDDAEKYARRYRLSGADVTARSILFGQDGTESLPAMSKPSLAKRSPSALLKGDRNEEAIDSPSPRAGNLISELPYIPILGRVAAGVWGPVKPANPSVKPKPSRFPPDPRYPIDAQFDLVVEGNSLNLFAQDGEILRCVDLVKARLHYRDGDLVIVSRSRASDERETTAKRVRTRNGRYELWPESDDPDYQKPFVIEPGGEDQHDEIEVIAIVLYAYKTP